MLWGCFSYHGVGRLYMTRGKVDAPYYCKILKFCAKPSLQAIYGDTECFFQHDNAPVHTAASSRKAIDDLGMNAIWWPGQSPDLNPIEHLWAQMKRKLHGRRFKNAQELFEGAKNEWCKVEKQNLEKLVESMPRRIQACIKARGGATKY